jgi:hypothetical protein
MVIIFQAKKNHHLRWVHLWCEYRIGVERNHTVLLLYVYVFNLSTVFLKTVTARMAKEKPNGKITARFLTDERNIASRAISQPDPHQADF